MDEDLEVEKELPELPTEEEMEAEEFEDMSGATPELNGER